MSLEPDSALPFESEHAATARTQPLREETSVSQSTNSARDGDREGVDADVDALSLFESEYATARTQPLREETSVPQSTNSIRDDEREGVDADVDALSLFSPDPSPRQVPEDTISHPGTTPAALAAAAIFRKLFPSHRAASPPSGDDVQASRDDFSDLLDARAQIAEEFTRFEARCRETETRSERAASAIDEIEQRLSGLDVVRDLAETMDGRLNALRQLSEEARIRTDDLKAQGEAIAHQLLAADHVTSVLTTLDARLAEVTEKDQRLLESEQMVAQLKRRAADTSANLERQLGEFETRKHVIEQAVAALEQRSAQTTNDVEQLTSGLDTRKDIIAQATSEATRVTGVLSALETRLTRLTSPEHGLGQAEQTLEAIERRATDASERLTQRVGDFDAQEDIIEQSLRVKTEQMVAQVERRAADASANLEGQLGEFEARKHVIEQAVAALEQRAAQTTNDVEELTSGLDTRKDIIEQATSEATRVAGLLSALETRLTRLTTPEHGLGRAEKTLEAIERRATDASERLTQRVGDFEAQEAVIERSLRVKAEQMVAQVERRAADTSAILQRQLGEFETRKQVIEHAVAALEQRAAQATNDVEQLTSGLDTRKDIIEQTTSEATRAAGLLSALETRLARLTTPEHGLGRAEKTLDEIERRATDASERLTQRVGHFAAQEEVIEQSLRVKTEHMVAQVERRAADTSAILQRQLGEFETRKHVIEQAVAALDQRATDASERLTQRVGDFEAQEEVIERSRRDAKRIIEVLSGLEKRIVNLTGTDQILDRADTYVGGLERRAAAAALQLEETTTLKNKVDQELAQLLRHLESLTQTARRETGKRADDWKETCRRRVRRVRAAFGPAVAARWRTVLDWWSRIPHRGALIRALAVAVLLVVGATALVRPLASMLRSVGRSSSTPVLLSRPFPEVMFAAQTPPSGVVGRVARDVLRSSATLETSEDIADGQPPAKRSAGAAVFIGALSIESQPPGATVFVDRQLLGKTPVRLTSLRAGEHLVRLEHEGFEPWTASVRVPADRQTRVSPTLQVDSPR